MKKRILVSLVMVISFLLWGGGIGYAKVTGRCDNCHTMHNSQDGADLYAAPYDTLLKGDCMGCHSSSTSTTTYALGTSTVPVVNYTGGVPATYLAGGNFYWVADLGGDDDAKGHNVLGIATQDLAITAAEGAPGNQYACANSCHMTLAVAISGQDASLRSGCQGCHLNVKHHANDGTGTKYVDTAAKGWYRFLARHSGGAVTDHGVKGIEDADWQATVAAGDHNEYLGVPVDKTGATALTNYSMTAFCCGCHGEFHTQNANAATGAGSQSPWIRHPSDFVIPNALEYASMSTTYNPNVPVARTSTFAGFVAGVDFGIPSATVAAGTDMVMCLSCHRPHGSPNDDLLRWDYAGMIAGGGANATGCFVCHTTKDD